MKSAKKAKFVLPEESIHIACRACGELRALDDFRIYQAGDVDKDGHRVTPHKYMDFCVLCERGHGTLTLYRRFNAYGTPEIANAVYRAANTPEIHRTTDQARLLVVPKVEREPRNAHELLQQELERRELCRRNLLYFVTQRMPEYLPGWAHQDICRRLQKFVQDVREQKSPRLMLAMPPRFGKSQLASTMFPAWVLGHEPSWPIILSSYAQELPLQFSREIRDMLRDPDYQAIFPDAKIRTDAQGVEAWKTTKSGGLKAIGVGGGLTGFGGRILIADDLIKDAEAAASDVIRENTFRWYKQVFRTRLAPGGGLLMIGTRWHWHDPQGRALETEEQLKKAGVPEWEREGWEVVAYPAIAEHDEYLMHDGTIEFDVPTQTDVKKKLRSKGEALHPERFPLPELMKIKHGFTTSEWSALYQQSPTPDEGDFFKKPDIQYRWLDPAYYPLCRLFLCVDYALGKKQRNDFTVMGVYALDSEHNLYCIAKVRGRWGTYDIAQNAVALIKRFNPEVYAGEHGQIHMAVWPVIAAELAKQNLFISVDETLVPMQDKEVRARPLQARMQARKMFYSYDEKTRPEIYDINERELLQFPNGVHDDCVDADAWAARLAMNLSVPTYRPPTKREPGWAERLGNLQNNSTTDHMAA